MKKLKISLSVLLCCAFLMLPFQAYAFTFSDANTVDYTIPDTSALYIKSKQLGYNQFLFYDLTNEKFKYIAVDDRLDSDWSRQFMYNPSSNGFYISLYKSGITSYSYYVNYAYYEFNGSTWSGEYSTPPSSTLYYDTTTWLLLAYDVQTHLYDDITHNEYFKTLFRSGGDPEVVTNIQDVTAKYSWNNDGSISGQSSGSGSGEGGNVSVDLTTTNNLLDRINSSIEDVNSNVLAVKNAINNNVVSALSTISSTVSGIRTDMNTKLQNINTSISTGFSNLTTFLTTKYEILYNVILYGSTDGESEIQEREMALEDLETDFDGITSSLGDVATMIDNAGDDVVIYIETFTEFYNGMAAVSGLAAIIAFALIIILVKKVIGR